MVWSLKKQEVKVLMMSKDYNYNKMIQSRDWLILRKKKIGNSPFCEECCSKGIITPVSEVHHVVPVESGSNVEDMRRLMFDYNNLKSLCHECHTNIHAMMHSHSKEYIKERSRKDAERFAKKYFE